MVDVIKRKGRFRIGKKGNLMFCIKSDEVLYNVDDPKYYEQMSRFILEQKSPDTKIVFLVLPSYK